MITGGRICEGDRHSCLRSRMVSGVGMALADAGVLRQLMFSVSSAYSEEDDQSMMSHT